MNYDSVLGKYNDASDAAWELAKAEQIQAMNAAERSNYANTKNGVSEIRNALAGSAASGANRGAANATALQALLGLGQQNAEATTAGMQNYQNAAKEAAAARAQNAISALDFNKSATDSMYGSATSAYGSDKEALGQAAYGAAGGLGQIGSTGIDSSHQYVMNKETNDTNLAVQKLVNAGNEAVQKLANAGNKEVAKIQNKK